jgi:hypothetical protein
MAASSKMLVFLCVGETTGDKESDLATREGTFSFHTVACLQPKFPIDGLYSDNDSEVM